MKTKITARGFEINGELQKYVRQKMTAITRKIPLKLRENTTCEAALAVRERKNDVAKICTLTLHLPAATFTARETTQHMYAALDITTADIVQQLHTYVAENRLGPIRRHLPHRPEDES